LVPTLTKVSILVLIRRIQSKESEEGGRSGRREEGVGGGSLKREERVGGGMRDWEEG
jgi:hypothetical protein